MHYCPECKTQRSGGHTVNDHLNNPLFLSYNMRMTLRKKYPHVYILPQKHLSFTLEDRLKAGDPSIKKSKWRGRNIFKLYKKQALK